MNRAQKGQNLKTAPGSLPEIPAITASLVFERTYDRDNMRVRQILIDIANQILDERQKPSLSEMQWNDSIPYVDQIVSALNAHLHYQPDYVDLKETSLKVDSPHQIIQLLFGKLASFLDSQEWAPLVTVSKFRGHAFQSSIVPFNEHATTLLVAGSKFPLAQYGTTGKASVNLKLADAAMVMEPSRLVNLWHSSVSLEGHVLYQGIRSGSFLQYRLADEEAKKASITATISELLEVYKALGGNRIFPRGILTINLQSGLGSLEPGHRDTGEPEIVATEDSFLVSASMKSGIPILHFCLPPERSDSYERGNYQLARTWNDDPLGKLQEACSSFEGADELRTTLQVRYDNSEFSAGKDPYGFAALVAYVGNLSGYLVHMHCRSGKDRTGVVDAEVKTLALQRAIRDREFNLDDSREIESSQNLRTWFILKEGAYIQRLNTGLQGTAISPYKQLSEEDPLVGRFGVRNWPQIIGESALVSY